MGGWLTIAINILAAYSFFHIGSTALMVMSIINGIVSLWSFGVMHNYASYAMREKADLIENNLQLEGRLDEESKERLERLKHRTDHRAIPTWIATINFLSFLLAVVLIVVFFFVR